MQKTVLLKLSSFFILCSFFVNDLRLEVAVASKEKTVEKKESTTTQTSDLEKKDSPKNQTQAASEVKPENKKALDKSKVAQEEPSEDDEDILSGKTIFKPMIDEAAKKYGFRGNWVEKKILLMKAAGYLSDISQTNKEIIEARKSLYAAKIDEVSVLLKSFRLISGSKKEDEPDHRLNRSLDIHFVDLRLIAECYWSFNKLFREDFHAVFNLFFIFFKILKN